MDSTLRLHHSKNTSTSYCEQFLGVSDTSHSRRYMIEDDDQTRIPMEWKRSYTASRVNRLKREAHSERIALCWDPESRGGIARYFPLSDDHVFSLTRCVGKTLTFITLLLSIHTLTLTLTLSISLFIETNTYERKCGICGGESSRFRKRIV